MAPQKMKIKRETANQINHWKTELSGARLFRYRRLLKIAVLVSWWALAESILR